MDEVSAGASVAPDSGVAGIGVVVDVGSAGGTDEALDASVGWGEGVGDAPLSVPQAARNHPPLARPRPAATRHKNALRVQSVILAPIRVYSHARRS